MNKRNVEKGGKCNIVFQNEGEGGQNPFGIFSSSENSSKSGNRIVPYLMLTLMSIFCFSSFSSLNTLATIRDCRCPITCTTNNKSKGESFKNCNKLFNRYLLTFPSLNVWIATKLIIPNFLLKYSINLEKNFADIVDFCPWTLILHFGCSFGYVELRKGKVAIALPETWVRPDMCCLQWGSKIHFKPWVFLVSNIHTFEDWHHTWKGMFTLVPPLEAYPVTVSVSPITGRSSAWPYWWL